MQGATNLRKVTKWRSYPLFSFFSGLLAAAVAEFLTLNCRFRRSSGSIVLRAAAWRLRVWQSKASRLVLVVRQPGHLYWKQSTCLFSTWLKQKKIFFLKLGSFLLLTAWGWATAPFIIPYRYSVYIPSFATVHTEIPYRNSIQNCNISVRCISVESWERLV